MEKKLKMNVSIFFKIKIILTIFSKHSSINLQINKTEIKKIFNNTCNLNKLLLKNQLTKEDIKKKILILEMNDSE
jgi:hypothetical protein